MHEIEWKQSYMYIFSFNEEPAGRGFEEQATIQILAQQGEKTLDLTEAEEIAIECEAEDVREGRDENDQEAFIVREQNN